jgi:protein-S-isoprenylcysteine O-methyltransferase Ste14
MENDKIHPQKYNVHKILAHSYSVYFLFFLIGVCLDLVFDFKVFNSSIVMPFGFIFLIFGTFLILWAQKTSRNLKKDIINKETFCHGPYYFTRTPTNFGLFFLMLGFGLIINAFFVVLFAFVSFVIAKLTFLKKEEEILALKYGAPYLEYKESVRF